MASLGDIIFTLATFIVLMLLVGKFAWKPVADMMAKRSAKVTGDLDYAEKSRQEAEALAAKRQAELQSSQADAVAIVNQAKANGEKQRQTLIDAANADVVTMKQTAATDIAQAKQDALNEAKNDVATLSLAVAEKLLGKELDANDQKDLIDQYIKELGDVDGAH